MTNRAHRRPARSAHRPPLPRELVTVREAAAAAWTESAQRHAVGIGDLERVRRGVLGEPVEPAPGTTERRLRELANLRGARASALACPRAAISHSSAAIALGIPTFGPVDRPCLTVQAGTRLRTLAEAHLHRATLTDGDVCDVDGWRVLVPARTVMDVAREHGVRAGVVAADHALHAGLVDATSLAAAFEVCARWPGRKAARITLLVADGAAESPLESLSRLCISGAGLPAPRPQARICDEHGRFLGRCDFYWDEFGVVGEADGDLKYARGQPAIVEERGRHADFEDTGLIVVRWGWASVYSFDSVARRLRTSFARGARPGSRERRWGVLLP